VDKRGCATISEGGNPVTSEIRASRLELLGRYGAAIARNAAESARKAALHRASLARESITSCAVDSAV
jgi:hypothetical protein